MENIMKAVCSAVLLLLILSGSTVFAMQHEATTDKGKALFNDPKLGTSGKTCNDCHKDGTGLERAGDQKDLDKIVNNCITAGLKGKALKPKSVEMQSLLLYLKSLGAEKKPAAKKAPVGC
jgi:cytochrome c peroxidase